MPNQRQSFNFYWSYYDYSEGMSQAQRDRWCGGIVAYYFDDVEPEFTGELARAFKLARPNIDTAKGRSKAASKPRTKREQNANKTLTKPEQNVSNTPLEDIDKELDIDKGLTPIVPFERFWSIWPKKVAKSTAEKSWNKLAPNEEIADSILTAIERQKHSQQWRKDNGQYIPHAATWLNQRRWEDETEGGVPDDIPQFKTVVQLSAEPTT
jgi:hypothetical protein